MKKLEFVIRPEKLEELKAVLRDNGASGLMVANVTGFGNQNGITAQYRGVVYTVNLLPKVCVTTVTTDANAEKMIAEVLKKLPSGEVGDGKIFVSDVTDVIRLRTGDRGEAAL